MLSLEYSWRSDYNADKHITGYTFSSSTQACADGGDILAGFNLSSVNVSVHLVHAEHHLSDLKNEAV